MTEQWLDETGISLRGTIDVEPWDVYRSLRENGAVWDEGIGGLLIGSYALVRSALRQDERALKRPNGTRALKDPLMVGITRSPRDITLLYGEDHGRYHRWWYEVMSRSICDAWRPTRIRPIVNSVLDRLVDRTVVELVTEFAEQVPIRVIASILGLPWEDDEWIESCRAFMDARMDYAQARSKAEILGRRPDGMDEVGQRAVRLTDEVVQRLLPYAERAMADPDHSDDLICTYAKDGPGIFPDWNMDDMLAGILTTFFAGSHTTSRSVSNGFYLLLTREGLIDQLRAGGEAALTVFVDEAMRLLGSTHFGSLDVIKDTTVGDLELKCPSTVVAVVAAANLDPEHYECPNEVRLDRPHPRDHAGFWLGPRACGGMWLARAEMLEMYTALVERVHNVRLDPDAEPPSLVGWTSRSYRPLHVRWDGVGASGA